MRIKDVITVLEAWAPPSLQEDYDNCGLQVGDPSADVTSALVCLDCTEAVVAEAAAKGCGLIITHHPVIFKGLKSLVARTYVERTVLAALKHGIAIYAIHTNLDNVLNGVNGEIAARLGLLRTRVLAPRSGQLRKLAVFVPLAQAEAVRKALFGAGAGQVGAYDECSFSSEGVGTFKAGEGTDPFVGKVGERHQEPEVRVEVILPPHLEGRVVAAMRSAHPYEEVAFDLIPLANGHPGIGSGLVGEWDQPLEEGIFLSKLKEIFGLRSVRHTALLGQPVRRIALCGGSGSFLLEQAVASGADAFLTGDLKYHQYFDADRRLLLADIGHYGSEQFTPALIARYLEREMPTFAVRLTETVTDPIHYS
ncbi:MAG: Nif3-like dinuclear metal center hexameric protein [Flavobacteriales bacterium]|nr:Nif3-like dinuclear metal center hexameric protein [Flavobacteriales bacterium]